MGSFYAGSKWKMNVNDYDGVVEMGCCWTIDEKRIGGIPSIPRLFDSEPWCC